MHVGYLLMLNNHLLPWKHDKEKDYHTIHQNKEQQPDRRERGREGKRREGEYSEW